MATEIGFVKAIVGEVTATSANGSMRTLKIGDRVYADEVIATGLDGVIQIEFTDGSTMDMGRSSQAMLNSDMFDPSLAGADPEAEVVPDDVAAIQQALLEGEDPTEIGEATAAGAGVEGGNEGHEPVFVDYLNPAVTPVAGFDTIGVSNIYDLPEEDIIFIEEEEPNGFPLAGTNNDAAFDEDDLPIEDDLAQMQILFLSAVTSLGAETGVNYNSEILSPVGNDDVVAGDDLLPGSLLYFSGVLNASYGPDGPGALTLNTSQPGLSGLTSGGEPISVVVSADGMTLIGYHENGTFEADIVFVVVLDPGSLTYSVGLFDVLDHMDGSTEDNLTLDIGYTITDGNGDSASGNILVNVDDDSPLVSLSLNSDQQSELPLGLVVDESVGTDGSVKDEPGLADNDDETVSVDDTDIGYVTISGALLFDIDVDAGADAEDLAARSFALSLTLAEGETEVDSGLDATNGGDIMLSMDGDDIVGMDGDTLIFRISIDAETGDVTVSQYQAIDHGDDDNDHDALLSIGEGLIGANVTVYDNDGDSATSEDVDLGRIIGFEDDGPAQLVTANAEAAAELAVELDETVGEDRGNADIPEVADGNNDDAGPGLAQVTTAVSGGLAALFTASGSYGSDGAGTLTDALSFTGVPGEGLATSLSATDGGAITLYLEGGELVGRDGDNDIVFTVAIVESPADSGEYQLQTTLFEAIDHGEDGDLYDVVTQLLLEGEGEVQLQYEVTRTDGDGDEVVASDQITLINANGSVFSFDDDGPEQTVTANAEAAAALAVELDETEGEDRTNADVAEVADGNTDDAGPGLAQVTTAVSGGLAALFTASGSYGSDGAGTLTDALSFTGVPGEGLATSLSATDGGAITLYLEGGELVGRDGDNDIVFTVAIVESPADSGEYQLQTTLFEAIDHGEDGDLYDVVTQLLLEGEGEVQLQYEVTRTDGDGDEVVASDQITLIDAETSVFSFDDDGPEVSLALAAEIDPITVDESVGTDGSTQDEPGLADNDDETGSADPDDIGFATMSGAALFNVNVMPGSDGEDSDARSFALTLSLADEETEVDSGLDATDGGDIMLSWETEGSVIVGTDDDGHVVFRISIDAETGDITVSQYEAINHGEDDNDHDALLSIGEGLIGANVTVYDNDGDSATSNDVELGSLIGFEDDGPAVSMETEPEVSIVIDESVGTDGSTKDEPGLADNDDETDSADPDDIGFATLSGAALFNVNVMPGSDGEDSDARSFALTLSLADEETEVDSGLDAIDGDDIMLSWETEGSVIVGTDGDGHVVFRISIDAETGDITVSQYEAIDHGEDGNDHDALVTIGEGLIGANVTVYDNDGDSATSEDVELGSLIGFEDDGPAALDEASQDVTEGNTVTGTLDFDGGSDGATVTHINDVELVFDAEDEGYSQDIDIGNGSIKVKADGSYSYTADEGLVQPVTDTASYTVTDGDGDTATADIDFNITDANAPTAGTSAALVDDDGLPGGLDNGAGDDTPDSDPDNDESTYSGTLDFSFGGDGAGSIDFATMHGETDTLGTETVTYSWDGGSDTLTATITGGDRDSTDLFTVTVNPVTGAYTVTLLTNVLHESLDGLAGDDTENNDSVSLTFTVTDADNSTDDGTLTINFDDDTPTVDVDISGEADVVMLTQDADTDGDPTDTDTAVGAFGSVFTMASALAGADGQDGSTSWTYTLNLDVAEGTDSGLDSGGNDIYLYQLDDGTVVGSTSNTEPLSINASVVFSLSVDGDGNVTLSQYETMDHLTPEDMAAYDDDVLSLANGLVSLTGEASITDNDGDTATDSETIDLGGNVQFADDGPAVDVDTSGEADVILLTQDAETDGDPTETDTAVGAFGSVFTLASALAGADGQDGSTNWTYTLNLDVAEGTDSGLNSGGNDIYLYQMDDGTVIGSTSNTEPLSIDASVVFSLSVDGDGNVTLSQYQVLDHLTPETMPAYDDDILSLANGLVSLTGEATITDGDGDTATDSETIDLGGNIQFADDGPVFTIVNDGFDLDNIVSLVTQNPTSDMTYFGNFADWVYGADGFGDYSLTLPAGVELDELASDESTIVLNFYEGEVLVASLTLNADGEDSLEVFRREPEVEFIPVATAAAEAGGPVGSILVDLEAAADFNILVTATKGGVADDVNASTQGWGVDNQNINTDETITFSFVDDGDNTTPYGISDFKFQVTKWTGGFNGAVAITVVFIDADTMLQSSETLQFASVEDAVITISELSWSNYEAGDELLSVKIVHGNATSGGAFNINGVEVGAESVTPPDDLSYEGIVIDVVDGDGDMDSQEFSLVIDGDEGDGLEVEAITGTSGNDVLIGTAGDDFLIGGAGDDILTGDTGADTFEFTMSYQTGVDEITDFEIGVDTLSFSDVLDINNDTNIDFADVVASIDNGGVGNDLTINMTNGSSVTLTGLGTADPLNTAAQLESYLGNININTDS